jgi:hypothetical protein
MKSWLSKFKISAALDADDPQSPPNRERSDKPDDVRTFAESVQSVDRALRNQPPAFKPPPDLHFTIMNEVRQAARCDSRSPRRGTSGFSLRWLPVPGVAALALVAVWWLLNRPASTPVRHPVTNSSSLEVGPALELGANATRDIPPVVVGPLSDELDRINTDLSNTAYFLLSSLP